MQKTFLFIKKFSEFFSSIKTVTPILVLGSLLMQTKTSLYSISGIASTGCVYTQPQKASTACVMTQTEFSQIFSYGTSSKIDLHKGKIPYPLALQNQNDFSSKKSIKANRFLSHKFSKFHTILQNSDFELCSKIAVLCKI